MTPPNASSERSEARLISESTGRVSVQTISDFNWVAVQMRTAVTISVSTESGREREVTSRVTRVRDSLDSPSPSDGRVARLPGRRIMEASSGTMVIFESSPRMDPAAVASPNLCTLPVSASVKEAKPIVVVRAVRTHAVARRLIARRAASEREQSLVRRISIMI